MARLEVQLLTGRTDPTLARMLQRDPEVAIELACDYISVGDWATAEAVLTGGAGENARSGMTWLMAGWCAFALGQADKTAEYRARADAAPVDMVFPSRVAELMAAEQAMRSGAVTPRVAYYAGLVLMRLMRYDEAIAAWGKAIDAKDDNALARRCLALTLSAVKQDRQGAVAHLERATAIDPRQPVYYQDLAGLYVALGRSADAKDVLARAVRNTTATDALVGYLAAACLATGDYREATQALAGHRFNVTEGRYGVHDDYAVAWIGVGLTALRDGQPQEALAALEKALEYPDNLAIGRPAGAQDESMVHFWRGVALRRLGRNSEATKAFEASAGQSVSERGRRRGFYRTLTTAHGILALRVLGRSQEAADRVERLTRAPATSRWVQQDDFYRAGLALRAVWVQGLRADGAIDPAAFTARARTHTCRGSGRDCRRWLRRSCGRRVWRQRRVGVASVPLLPVVPRRTNNARPYASDCLAAVGGLALARDLPVQLGRAPAAGECS